MKQINNEDKERSKYVSYNYDCNTFSQKFLKQQYKKKISYLITDL